MKDTINGMLFEDESMTHDDQSIGRTVVYPSRDPESAGVIILCSR